MYRCYRIIRILHLSRCWDYFLHIADDMVNEKRRVKEEVVWGFGVVVSFDCAWCVWCFYNLFAFRS
jgi:hypothetical protein